MATRTGACDTRGSSVPGQGMTALVMRMANGPGPWAALVWVPLLVIEPALYASSAGVPWLAWSALVGIVATHVLAVAAAQRPDTRGGRRLPGLLIGAQAVLTVAATAGFGPHWFTLYILLAIDVGAVLTFRWTLHLLGAVVAGATVVAWLATRSWDTTWTVALTTFLAGASTFAFHALFRVIAELNHTREELALAAVSEERLRIARDMHDLLGHTLSVIVVKAEAVRRLVPRAPETAAEHAADIEAIGREALGEVRQAVTGYRSSGLLLELARARTALTAAGIELTVDDSSLTLPQQVDALLGWVVREGITNVIRHSGARRCDLGLRRSDGTTTLTLADDGSGGAAGQKGTGSGLAGLRERLAGAGGTLRAEASGTGFLLTAEIPDRREHREEDGS